MRSIQKTSTADTVVNQGLRSYFNDVFSRMTTALLISAMFAYIGMRVPMLYAGGALTWMIILSPLAFILIMSFGAERFSDRGLLLMLMGFGAAQGLSMGALLYIYTAHSVITAFLMAAIVFSTFAIIGYTTKRDLSAMGTFLFVGLIGIIIASIVNIWLNLTALAFVVNVLAVLIFTGLTAYDMQKLKHIYLDGGDSSRVRTFGALSLYLDFINIFVSLLQLIGNKR
jgi:FtsH-binding integral membrane protein